MAPWPTPGSPVLLRPVPCESVSPRPLPPPRIFPPLLPGCMCTCLQCLPPALQPAASGLFRPCSLSLGQPQLYQLLNWSPQAPRQPQPRAAPAPGLSLKCGSHQGTASLSTFLWVSGCESKFLGLAARGLTPACLYTSHPSIYSPYQWAPKCRQTIYLGFLITFIFKTKNKIKLWWYLLYRLTTIHE